MGTQNDPNQLHGIRFQEPTVSSRNRVTSGDRSRSGPRGGRQLGRLPGPKGRLSAGLVLLAALLGDLLPHGQDLYQGKAAESSFVFFLLFFCGCWRCPEVGGKRRVVDLGMPRGGRKNVWALLRQGSGQAGCPGHSPDAS